MSTFKNDPGFGQLFRNKYREDGDKKPIYKGAFTDPNGKEWEIAGWVKDGVNGKFLSLKIQEPFVKTEPVDLPADFDDADDVPF